MVGCSEVELGPAWPAAGEPAAWVTEDTKPLPKNIYGVTKTAAEELCPRLLCLPLFDELEPREVRQIVSILRRVLK